MIGFGQYFSHIQNTPFTDVSAGSVAFSDIDNDGDDDVLITGYNNGSFSELYKNDGLGNFTLVSNTPFTGVIASSVAFSDIDSDGDKDLLITGEYSYSNGICYVIAELYKNNGSGIFSLVTGTPFTGFLDGSMAFSDIDNDGDEDILITGRRGMYPNYDAISELYKNDGLGNFSLVIAAPFPKIWASSVAFSDIDNDGDQDLLITGNNDSSLAITELYKNDGLGNFSLVSSTPFIGVYASSIAFSDIDNDGDEDLLIAGRYCTNGICYVITELYKNDGLGNFSLVSTAPFSDIYRGSISFSDIDQDGDKDVLITGNSLSELYKNDGLGNFSLVSGTPFTGVYNSSIAFSDIDKDGDEDVLIIGGVDVSSVVNISSIYRNIFAMTSVDEFSIKNNNLLKITNIFGQTIKKENNTPSFYIYDDGTVEKRMVIE